MDDIKKWLKALRLHKYTNLFEALTYDQMLNLTEDYLIDQNVTKGARNKMLVSIKKLNLRAERLTNMLDDLTHDNISLKEALSVLKDIIQTPIPEHDDLTKLFVEIFKQVAQRYLNVAFIEKDSASIMTVIVDECTKHKSFTKTQKELVASYKHYFRQRSAHNHHHQKSAAIACFNNHAHSFFHNFTNNGGSINRSNGAGGGGSSSSSISSSCSVSSRSSSGYSISSSGFNINASATVGSNSCSNSLVSSINCCSNGNTGNIFDTISVAINKKQDRGQLLQQLKALYLRQQQQNQQQQPLPPHRNQQQQQQPATSSASPSTSPQPQQPPPQTQPPQLQLSLQSLPSQCTAIKPLLPQLYSIDSKHLAQSQEPPKIIMPIQPPSSFSSPAPLPSPTSSMTSSLDSAIGSYTSSAASATSVLDSPDSTDCPDFDEYTLLGPARATFELPCLRLRAASALAHTAVTSIANN